MQYGCKYEKDFYFCNIVALKIPKTYDRGNRLDQKL